MLSIDRSQGAYLLFLSCLAFLGCSKYYVTAKRELIDKDTLASTFVQSPDPRQCAWPQGEEITFEWRLPREALNESLELVIALLYSSYKEETRRYPIRRRRGTVTVVHLGQEEKERGKIVTYRAQIVTNQGRVIKEWKQQLWTELITVDSFSDTER